MNQSSKNLVARELDKHLDNTGTTLWGRSWDITQSSSRKEAIEWFIVQVDAVLGDRLL